LRLHPQIDFRWVGPGQTPPPADLVVLPGSKSVAADLAWLQQQDGGAWRPYLQRHLRYGGKVIGLCGGYQMLGRSIDDPDGVEGKQASVPGLSFLDCRTTLSAEKQLRNVTGQLTFGDRPAVAGYEIHMGVTTGPALARPAVRFDDGRGDGAISEDGQILGTYCHGVFEHPQALTALLAWVGADAIGSVDLAARRETDIDRLADAVQAAMDWPRLDEWLLPQA
jgi:adenosylcobyric acid synthase